MKRLFILMLLIISGISNAQVFSPTGGWAGVNTIPPGWTSTGSASSSTINFKGSSSPESPWVFQPLPSPPSGQSQFLTLFSKQNVTQNAETKIYGLQPGIWYEIKYHVMTASYTLNGGPPTDLADKAFIEITGDPGAVASHNFDKGLNSIKWTAGSLTFVASATEETFKFNVTSSSVFGAVANLDISSISMVCGQATNEVRYEHPILFKRCPESTVNLNDAFTGIVPAGTTLVWYKNATHSGNPVIGTDMISQPGDYYGFFKNTQKNCFNTDMAYRKVIVHQADVKLKSDVGQITCYGETKFDLNTLHDTPPSFIPPGAQLVWFANPTHSGFPSAIGNLTSVPPGTYYAFYFFGAPYNCYSTDLSTDKVEVKLPTQVSLGQHKRLVVCPSGTAKLYEGASGVPLGTNLVYFDNPQGQGQSINPSELKPIGDYYAFSRDTLKGCLNTNLSTEKFTIAQVPELPPSTYNVRCSSKTFNLDSLGFLAPVGRLVWYTNPNHLSPKPGMPALDPKAAPPGNYWAFYYDDVQKCFNVSTSTAKFVIKDTLCKSRVVFVNLKVKLQGAIVGLDSTMKNTLQTYAKDQGGSGILPIKDPYSGEVVYEDINNVNGPLGAIVDWIKVELRSAANPATIIAKQSLLVMPNGKVVTPTGASPYFEAQEQPVHLVVKHRNHVAIMSQPITMNGDKATIGYDFTKALERAYTDGQVPPQMVQANGVWCMVSGDVSQNLIVKNEDVTQTRNSFNQGLFEVYSSKDLNMNGIINNLDVTIQRSRFNGGYFSILTNY